MSERRHSKLPCNGPCTWTSKSNKNQGEGGGFPRQILSVYYMWRNYRCASYLLTAIQAGTGLGDALQVALLIDFLLNVCNNRLIPASFITNSLLASSKPLNGCFYKQLTLINSWALASASSPRTWSMTSCFLLLYNIIRMQISSYIVLFE